MENDVSSPRLSCSVFDVVCDGVCDGVAAKVGQLERQMGAGGLGAVMMKLQSPVEKKPGKVCEHKKNTT